MEAKIDVAAILEDKPQGTKLYSLTYGDCFYQQYTGDFGIECVSQNGVQFNLTESGKYCVEGECILFPSKEMQDWLKFSWKKGDVLQHSEYPLTVIFESFEDDTYTSFKCKYSFDLESASKWLVSNSQCSTKHFYKVSEEEAKEFIEKVELNFNGKLNMDALEIETPNQFKDGDILVTNGYYYHDKKYIFIFSGYDENNSYNYRIVLLESGDLQLSTGIPWCSDSEEVRYATEEERQQLFEALAKEGKAWDAEKKMIVDLKTKVELKPFDKVLVRNSSIRKWEVDLFGYKSDAGLYHCVGYTCNQCIPYEGNEHLLGTTNAPK